MSGQADPSAESSRYLSEGRRRPAWVEVAEEVAAKRTQSARSRSPDQPERDVRPALLTEFLRPLLASSPAEPVPSLLSRPRLSNARSPCAAPAPSTLPRWARCTRSARRRDRHL